MFITCPVNGGRLYLSWLTIDPTLEMLETGSPFAAYRRFVQALPEEEVAVLYANQRATPMLGDASFRERTLRTADEVIAAVTIEFKVKPSQLLKRDSSRRGITGVARQMAMQVCRDRAGLTLATIGEHFGGIHYSAVSQNLRRMRLRREEESSVSDRYRAVLSRLDPRLVTDCVVKT